MAKKKTSTRKKKVAKTKADPRGNLYRTKERKGQAKPSIEVLGNTQRLSYDAQGLHVAELNFKSADFARKQRISRSSSSIDFRLQTDLVPMRDLSRDLYENNEIYQAVIQRAIECGVGPGYKPIFDFEDDGLNTELKARWEHFTLNPEIRGLFDWKETLEKVYSGYLVDGDIGAIIPKKKQTRLQLIEGIQIGRFNKLGVSLDKFRAPISYDVHSISEKSGQPISRSKTIPVEEFLLVANYIYPGQSRGIPVGQGIFPDVHRLVDVLDSEAIAWQLNARIALIVNKVKGAPNMPLLSNEKPEDNDKKDVSLFTQIMEAGNVYWGDKGDEVSSFDSRRPGLNFEKTVKLYAGIVGLPFGIPLPILMFDWEGLNYSTMRGLIEQAGKVFKKIQKLMLRRFCTPVYVWKLNQWAKGFDKELTGEKLRLSERQIKQLSKIKWDTPSFPWVDQLKESEAHGNMLDRTFTTQRQIASNMDLDYTEIRGQREIELKEAWEAAVKFEKDTNGRVKAEDLYRTFAGLEMGQTVRAMIEANRTPNQGDNNAGDS